MCLTVLLAAPGCSMLALAGGQLALINNQLPLPAAIAQEQDPARRALLREVPSILAFAEDVVGLQVGRSYSGYFETERSGLTYVVTACARTGFDAYRWWFPIVGTVEYRSYWDEAQAHAVASELEAEGYDTWVSPSRAYSSLGILRDPITTTMLRDGLSGLAEVLIHELSHAKLFIPGQTDWNEALASFVGERGAEQYFRGARFAGSPLQTEVERRLERRATFDQAVAQAFVELEQLYASARPESEKLALRQGVFDRLSAELRARFPEDPLRDVRVNNARLLHFRRYTAHGVVLEQLWAASGRSFRRFWRVAEHYAHTRL